MPRLIDESLLIAAFPWTKVKQCLARDRVWSIEDFTRCFQFLGTQGVDSLEWASPISSTNAAHRESLELAVYTDVAQRALRVLGGGQYKTRRVTINYANRPAAPRGARGT